MSKAGATVVLTPPGDTYLSLERGVIDAAEMVGPHDDVRLGLHRSAQYYYYPGWQEPGSVTEFVFNQKAYESLPADLRRILDAAAMAIKTTASTEYDVKNALALKKLRTEFRGKVEILRFPPGVMKSLKELAKEVNQEESERSPIASKVYASYTKFQREIQGWGRISEGPYYEMIAG